MKKLFTFLFIFFCISLAFSSRAQELVTTERALSVDETVQKVTNTVEELGMKIIAHINHAQAASKKNMQIPPTQVLIFGNLEVGTQLMHDDPRSGLDLPLRVLVWEENGTTYLSYRDPAYLQETFDLENKNELIAKIQNTMQQITEESTQ